MSQHGIEFGWSLFITHTLIKIFKHFSRAQSTLSNEDEKAKDMHFYTHADMYIDVFDDLLKMGPTYYSGCTPLSEVYYYLQIIFKLLTKYSKYNFLILNC